MAKRVALAQLREDNRCLVESALAASGEAYAPYSGFAVGAAVRTKSGRVYVGANVENAAYAVVICAEVSAVAAANAAGDFEIEAVAVAGHKFYPFRDTSQVVTPCGRCRQVIFEASEVSGTDVQIFSCNGKLSHITESKISELLPRAFGPRTLGLAKRWPKMRRVLRATVARLQAGTRISRKRKR